uniref:BTB domain-containing protein n=1 Tax=Oncorhynchus tshawytscha TaxID=74940 RepID=A0A8C8JCZ3_ONCTS
MSQLLHVEIPNFGSFLLESLNEQRMQDHYCDVAVSVNGQAFKAHHSVLATSSLYFRDLFSGSSQNVFELPSLVTPSCFQQILYFCYTGKLSHEQLVLMYTVDYLQIQNIVEHGMDLLIKANSPHCDSQAATPEDLGLEPLNPNINHPDLLPGGTPMATCRIKQERCESPMSEEHTARDLEGHATMSSALCYMVPGVQLYPLASGEHSSPGPSNLPATDSPTSHPPTRRSLKRSSMAAGIQTGSTEFMNVKFTLYSLHIFKYIRIVIIMKEGCIAKILCVDH